jgi:type II secretory pathway predicted ATPase ExeA
VIEKLQAHYGFTRMPFGRDLAPGMLHRHTSHNEAIARITWCISERSPFAPSFPASTPRNTP